jgi:hypothetical protein
MDRTAIDIVLEGVSNGTISSTDAKILLETINKPPQTVTVPYNTGTITTKPDWTYDPYRPGQPWYTVTSHTSGYSQAEGTTNNQPKTTLTTNG